MVLTGALRIVVAVFVVRAPFGPQAWHYLQYAVGLQRLGHDVTVVEVADDNDWTCYDPTTATSGTDATAGLDFMQQVTERLGLGNAWAYFDRHASSGPHWRGPAAARMPAIARDADIYLNVSGLNPVAPWFSEVPKRVFVDTDPGFVQVNNLTKPAARALCQQHNVHLTFGERIGAADCLVPDDGFTWQPTRQPVVLDLWRATPVAESGPFTTVMKWESYRPVSWGGLALGLKSESFAPYLQLPTHVTVPFELVVGGPHPRDLLERNGWKVHHPDALTASPWDFQEFVRRSAAEFTVAKQGYVVTRSGWFSERSAHYLASGRPVVTEDTGFAAVLPTGEGLLSFSDKAEAATALDEVRSEISRHGKAARAIAEAHFDAATVLPRLLDDVFA